jgi:hypothetical protein
MFIGCAALFYCVYYIFKKYPPLKAFILISITLTTICGAAAAFIDMELPPPIYKNPIPMPSKPISINEYFIEMKNSIKQNDIELSNFHTKQWDDGNYLWIFTGSVKNNSETPLNSLDLELKLADCGRIGEKNNCLSAKSIFVTISDLNIKPHEKGQFDTTYAINDLTHKYRVNAIFKEAYNVTQEKRRYAQPIYQTPNIDMNEIAKHYQNVDRMVICGGGVSVDRPYPPQKRYERTMLADNRKQDSGSNSGC